MSSHTPSKRSDVIAEEAAEYFVALKSPDAKAKAEFIDWLKVSPEHVNEFLAVAALWDDLPEVSTQPSAEELIRLAAGDQNVIELEQPGRSTGNLASVLPGSSAQGLLAQPGRGRAIGRRAWWLATAVAGASVVTFVGWLIPHWLPFLDPNLYRTEIGEQTSVSLADGSIVTLNTRSTMRVQYDEGLRVVSLTEGEALFDVAKDPERPFRVITESAVIQAVGTQFNVRSVAKDVTITVVEGIVDVSAKQSAATSVGQATGLPGAGQATGAAAAIQPVRLTVGQQARIDFQSGQVAVIEPPTVEEAIAWQQRRMVFEHLSLQEVIDEFNRYNDPPIVIDDPELQSLPISGVFRSNDPDSFVQFLSQMGLAESDTRTDGTIVLRTARQN